MISFILHLLGIDIHSNDVDCFSPHSQFTSSVICHTRVSFLLFFPLRRSRVFYVFQVRSCPGSKDSVGTDQSTSASAIVRSFRVSIRLTTRFTLGSDVVSIRNFLDFSPLWVGVTLHTPVVINLFH